ncbi:MAG: hypothetical protein LDL41_05465 [Coleofasciculus sp. S288]|nr:hypothetical protein [Coleofasciculus sp. S288]
MSFINLAIHVSTNLLLIARALPSELQRKNTTYDYTQYASGQDYLFEPIDGGRSGYITAQMKGIKRGDYLILPNGSRSSRYQVEEIDYYSNPSDMWTALVRQVPIE